MRVQWGWLSAVGRGYFLSSTVKNAKNINRQITVKKFQGIPNLTISADIHGHLAPEESLNWKNQSPCSQKHSL